MGLCMYGLQVQVQVPGKITVALKQELSAQRSRGERHRAAGGCAEARRWQKQITLLSAEPAGGALPLGTGQVLLCLILTTLWDQHCDEPHFMEAGKSRKHLNTITVCTVSAEARPQTRSVSASSSRSPLGHLALEAGENALWRKRMRYVGKGTGD